MVNNIGVITTWKGGSSSYAEKTPTVLAYTTNPPIWGRSAVKPRAAESGPKVRKITYFKLGLQPGFYRRCLSEGPLPFAEQGYKDPDYPNKTAADFTTDYLKCLLKWVREEYFPSQFGPAVLRGQTISYVITVPAIWTDPAKDLTRKAAQKAGIPEGSLQLITEPEAAALYCASLCHRADLTPGNRFIVCDAGGGTVVYSLGLHRSHL